MKKKESKTRSAKTASSAKSNPRGSKNGNRTTASLRSSCTEPTSGSERSTFDPQRSRTLRSEDETSGNVSRRLSGDLQSLSNEETTSESVEELAEEGQDLEGELLEGIEDAPAADQGRGENPSIRRARGRRNSILQEQEPAVRKLRAKHTLSAASHSHERLDE